jgi:uncharacterized protein
MSWVAMVSEPSKFLTARWIDLAMANYEVDTIVLQPFVPAGTEIDLWNGRCFVSVVGFQFLDTRVLGIPFPFHRHFEEVNLRFYVKRVVGSEIRRGVVFVKEIVPRRALAWVANALCNEKYVALPMAHEKQVLDRAQTVIYRWQHLGKWAHLKLAVNGDSFLPDENSEEAFITEHYWGYTTQRDGTTLEYRVEHPRWKVWKAVECDFACDVAALYGSAFAHYLGQPPTSCFLAEGSEVLVRRGVSL